MKEHKTIVDDNGNEIKIYPEMLATKEARKFFGLKLRPYEKEFPKIRRNEPCPCGSGLKYKKCCIDLKF